MSRRQEVAGRRSVPSPRPSSGGSGRDSGMVLLETALAIPILLAVAAALAWGLSLAGTSAVLGDAVRTAARELARGEAVGEALQRAQAQAPGALLTIGEESGLTVVRGSQEVSAPVPLLRGMTVTVRQQVAVPREWG